MLSNFEINQAGVMLLRHESLRSIERVIHTSYRTLNRLKKYLVENHISLDDWNEYSDEERRNIFYSSPSHAPVNGLVVLPEFELIYQKKENRNSHYSIMAGWNDYIRKNPDGYRKSQFYTHYRRWEQEKHPGKGATAPINRKPGKYLYIDWVGDQPALVRNPDNPDKKLKAHFLVFTMGYSSLTYAAAFPDEKTPCVIDGINRALSYMQALPEAFRPDNMKTAITSNTREGIVLSTAMEDLQSYYNTPVLPARPLKPRDKASVERAVLILESELLPRLDGSTFKSFDELNKVISEYLEDLNTRVKTGESMSRKDLFEKYDKPNMKPLPTRLFQLCEYKKLKVQRSCHIKYSGRYYSVPYQYVGQTVIVKISGSSLQICDKNNKPVWTHSLLSDPGSRYVTVETHLKSNYQKSRQVERRGIHYFYDQAEKVGPSVRKLLEQLCDQYQFEEQAYNSFNGIIYACDGYPNKLANQAAANCLIHSAIGYKAFVEELTRLAADRQIARKNKRKVRKETTSHSNIRGKDYYR